MFSCTGNGRKRSCVQAEAVKLDLMKNKAKIVGIEGSSVPTHELVYRTLRGNILFGEMAPGQPVTIQGLADALGVGMTPVREAIRRLISDGALVFQGNRRVSVPELSVHDIGQIIYVRKSIESEMTRRAMARITDRQIDTLKRVDAELDASIVKGDVAGYLVQNYRFHHEIYQIANAPILSEMADRLWLRFGPSLRVVCGRFGTQNLPDRHKDLLSALKAKDCEAAVRAIEQDIEQGMQQIALGLGDPVEPA